MQALGDVRYEPAVQVLTETVDGTRQRRRSFEDALDALARIASPSSAPLFKEQLTSKSIACRTIAVEGLARLHGTAEARRDPDRAPEGAIRRSAAGAMSFAATMLADAPIDQIRRSARALEAARSGSTVSRRARARARLALLAARPGPRFADSRRGRRGSDPGGRPKRAAARDAARQRPGSGGRVRGEPARSPGCDRRRRQDQPPRA